MNAFLLLLAAVLVLGGLLGTLMVRDPGYVLIAYDQMSVETSLWFAIAALIAGYFLLRLLIWLGLRLFRGGSLLSGYRARRRVRGARLKTNRGLLLLAEGQWRDAKRQLLAGARGVAEPLVNYLSAARAANALGDIEERDALLRKALESTGGSEFAVRLTHAELEFESGQIEQCIATLNDLLEHAPRHPVVLRRLAECLQRVGDWPALEALLPKIRKAGALSPQALSELADTTWRGRLGHAADVQALEQIWRALPRGERRRALLVEAYADKALQQGAPDAAAAALAAAVEHDWRPGLVERYGVLRGGDARARLKTAESWLKKHADDPVLALCLGRLALQNARWDQAREYLETSARLSPTPSAQAELGRLLAAQGVSSRAAAYLAEPLPALPAMPLPLAESDAGAAGAQAGGEDAAPDLDLDEEPVSGDGAAARADLAERAAAQSRGA